MANKKNQNTQVLYTAQRPIPPRYILLFSIDADDSESRWIYIYIYIYMDRNRRYRRIYLGIDRTDSA